jgi:hypothetical protein
VAGKATVITPQLKYPPTCSSIIGPWKTSHTVFNGSIFTATGGSAGTVAKISLSDGTVTVYASDPIHLIYPEAEFGVDPTTGDLYLDGGEGAGNKSIVKVTHCEEKHQPCPVTVVARAPAGYQVPCGPICKIGFIVVGADSRVFAVPNEFEAPIPPIQHGDGAAHGGAAGAYNYLHVYEVLPGAYPEDALVLLANVSIPVDPQWGTAGGIKQV